MTGWMRRTLDMLTLSGAQVEELVREQAGSNPWLEIAMPATGAAEDLVVTASGGRLGRAGGVCRGVRSRGSGAATAGWGRGANAGEQRRGWEAARALVRALAWREEVLLAVAQAVVEAQAEFLSGRRDLPRRLRLCELARQVHLHESTVGRVTRNKTVCTPRGRLSLRFLVNDRTHAQVLTDAIRAIITAASPGARLSDAEIARRLTAAGLTVARRTVSKHRRNVTRAEARRRQE